MNYILFTNVWNAQADIEKTFKMVFGFTKRPDLWVWINDGSTDNTEYMIKKCIDKYGINIPTALVCLPLKDEGDLSKIGQAYNFAFDVLKLKDMDFDFMSIIDVDNEIHKEYHSFVATMFNVTPYIGAISGYHPKEDKTKVPKGNGKCVRWDVIKNIERFWDPAPDMFLNIKTRKMGYEWRILDNIYGVLKGKASARNLTYEGSKYAGRLWAYVGASIWSAILRVGFRIIKKRYAKAFWRGYRENKDWRCEDNDVLDYYRSGIYWKIKKIWKRAMTKILVVRERIS